MPFLSSQPLHSQIAVAASTTAPVFRQHVARANRITAGRHGAARCAAHHHCAGPAGQPALLHRAGLPAGRPCDCVVSAACLRRQPACRARDVAAEGRDGSLDVSPRQSSPRQPWPCHGGQRREAGLISRRRRDISAPWPTLPCRPDSEVGEARWSGPAAGGPRRRPACQIDEQDGGARPGNPPPRGGGASRVGRCKRGSVVSASPPQCEPACGTHRVIPCKCRPVTTARGA